jgi:hypothetical protein
METGIVKLTKAFLFAVTTKAPAARNTCEGQGYILEVLILYVQWLWSDGCF